MKTDSIFMGLFPLKIKAGVSSPQSETPTRRNCQKINICSPRNLQKALQVAVCLSRQPLQYRSVRVT